MTMHDLNQALRYADRFIFLKGGKVHAHGGAEVITPQVIEEVYGLPVVIGEVAGMQCVVPEALKYHLHITSKMHTILLKKR